MVLHVVWQLEQKHSKQNKNACWMGRLEGFQKVIDFTFLDGRCLGNGSFYHFLK